MSGDKMCGWFFPRHKWGKWEIVEVKGMRYNRKVNYDYEVRYCRICNKRIRRLVASYFVIEKEQWERL